MANYYYSGQGRLYVGVRNANGLPDYLEELGNCPNLELSVEITKFEHKESQTGSRAVDLTIVQEKRGTFTMALESLTPRNLALAFWGTSNEVALGTATEITTPIPARLSTETLQKRLPLGPGIVKVSNVTIGDDVVANTPTAYEFGTSATDVASKDGWIDEANGVIIVFTDADQTAKGAAVNIAEDDPLYVNSYDNAAANQVDAFTETSQQRYLRFEGLNTVDNKEVIVDIYKADLDPLSGYGLINEEIGSIEITGSMLLDQLQPASSQFFRQTVVS